jgi:phosphoribosylglycinamide formyltransferase-1
LPTPPAADPQASPNAQWVPAAAPATVVVLASGTGSLLRALIEAAAAPDYPATVVAVGVDRVCQATEHAAAAGIPAFRMALKDFPDRAAWDVALTDAVAAYEPDLVVSAGFMKILGPVFLARYGGRIINTHPALLPAFPGAHGVRDALAYGVKVTGSTVHLVDSGIDTGPILAQEAVPVLDGDDEDTLHERIKVVERRLLAEVVAAVATRGIVSDGRKAVIPDERVLR